MQKSFCDACGVSIELVRNPAKVFRSRTPGMEYDLCEPCDARLRNILEFQGWAVPADASAHEASPEGKQ